MKTKKTVAAVASRWNKSLHPLASAATLIRDSIQALDTIPMKTICLTPLLAALTLAFVATLNAAENPLKRPATVDSLFSTEEILDESTLDIKILQDWHVDEVTGSTRQKLIEINVADWWPGQDYRIPVRMIVPLEGKAKGFSITGANPYEGLMEDRDQLTFRQNFWQVALAS